MSWAVVRVRGSVNVNPKIKETMKLMKLNRVNHCVIIPENDTYTGGSIRFILLKLMLPFIKK